MMSGWTHFLVGQMCFIFLSLEEMYVWHDVIKILYLEFVMEPSKQGFHYATLVFLKYIGW